MKKGQPGMWGRVVEDLRQRRVKFMTQIVKSAAHKSIIARVGRGRTLAKIVDRCELHKDKDRLRNNCFWNGESY